MNFSCKIVSYNSDNYLQWLALREQILRLPLKKYLDYKDVENDKNEIIICIFDGKKPVGGLQLKPVDTKIVKLRQMAIQINYRQRGLGKKLLNYAEKTALKLGFNRIELHARKTAVAFYQKSGYQASGSMFTEIGIPHMFMSKNIDK
jgi:predicted GNAT family N-acyltransferase